MTLILGLEIPKIGAFVSSDSYCAEGTEISRCDDGKTKTLMLRGMPVLVSNCGSIPTERAIHLALNRLLSDIPEEMGMEDIRSRFREMMEYRLPKYLREELGDNDDDECEMDGKALIAFDGKIYLLDDDISVWRNDVGFYAIGAGASYAKGAFAMEMLHFGEALSEPGMMNEEIASGILERVMNASASICNAVLPPFRLDASMDGGNEKC